MDGEPIIKPIATKEEFRRKIEKLIDTGNVDESVKLLGEVLLDTVDPDSNGGSQYEMVLEGLRTAYAYTEDFENGMKKFFGIPKFSLTGRDSRLQEINTDQ